jgi:hypothetical protein
MNLNYFKEKDFFNALNTLFNALNIPANGGVEEPVTVKEILKDTYKDNDAFSLVRDVYFVGMVDDAAFKGNESLSKDEIKVDYEGLLIFGLTLNQRANHLLPTRSHLAEISRAFNREFYYTPVTLVFKYQDDQYNYLALANTERLTYRQEWREGEKAGKVSLLRDINISNIHSGHQKILANMSINRSINSFDSLYKHWQTVFSVSLLNKRFYAELSNWYFWAVKEVRFPSEPTMQSMFEETGKNDEKKLQELKQEHNAKNVIRLLTRLLFVWFIKEKKLVPDELFDLEYIKANILEDLSPIHEDGLFASTNINSHYYKAILQNLFFATLNQDMGKRSFRNDKQHINVTNLMRYQGYFKDSKKYIDLVESTVPFMNGGLFECLDKPSSKKKGAKGGDFIVYKDGFSDRDDIDVVVPDYLFFGVDENVDLSSVIGISNKSTKQAAVKGLINIFNSYKFTISENTPIEEDVALDPELLGKVFENLLASYNPETKTTARKQSGSFYTPREVVNYMVDVSLITYLKNTIPDWGMQSDELDKALHELLSFDNTNPFKDNPNIQKQIIKALDKSTILDPACGSGAFPMGVLQKMVHVLDKIDPNSAEWNQRQINKVHLAIESLEDLDDAKFREQGVKDLKEQIKDMEDAFENNELDYGRKLFLIENCIFGVDIQPIAIQISKLRFFISLIVDQKIDKNKLNFGVRPLPNLETKFVAANTLIGIDMSNDQLSLFDKKDVRKLEKELKKVRHKLFSSKVPKRKRELRIEDKNLREKIVGLLEDEGMKNTTARQLAEWDPYDQNKASDFFDAEWMFDVKNDFDIVIGNPPYLKERDNAHYFEPVNNSSFGKKWHQGKMDFWFYFLHKSIDLSKSEICFITSRYWLNSQGAKKLVKRVSDKLSFVNVVDIGKLKVFDAVAGHHMISHFSKKPQEEFKCIKLSNDISMIGSEMSSKNIEINTLKNSIVFTKNNEIMLSNDYFSELEEVNDLGCVCNISQGVVQNPDKVSSKMSTMFDLPLNAGVFVLNEDELKNLCLDDNEISFVKEFYEDKSIEKYALNTKDKKYLLYLTKETCSSIDRYENINTHLSIYKKIMDIRRETINGNNSWFHLHWPRKKEYFENEKIVMPSMFTNNSAAYLNDKSYFGMSTNIINLQDNKYNLKYILAILNSSFAKKWFYTHGKHRGAGVDIGVSKLRLFPVKVPTSDSQEIFIQFSHIASSAKNISESLFSNICGVIDALVFQLYFSEHMKEKEIDILQFVERDLTEEVKNKGFENFSDSEKVQIINRLNSRWSDPNSEVLKRINSFSEKSLNILKPILEG